MDHKWDIPALYENDKSKNGENKAVNFEEALTMTGFGKFHLLVILISGLIFAAAGFQNGLNAYVMPSAQCDLELGSGEKGLLNAVFLGGSLASAFVWGICADHMGRKKVLVATLLADGVFTLASSLSQTFNLFAVFRFINGFLSGAPASIVLAYLGEFIGVKFRSPSVIAAGFFWTGSWMLLPAVAMAIIPISWSYHTDTFTYNSWRIFVALFAIPSLATGLVLAFFFPESPKFLYSQRRENEALEVLRKMFHFNYGQSMGDYPVKRIVESDSDVEKNTQGPPSTMKGSRDEQEAQESLTISHILRGVWEQICSLFRSPLIASTALASSLMFTNMFGYYGLGLWLPELFNRFEDHYSTSNESVTVCELSQMKQAAVLLDLNASVTDWEDCEAVDVNPAVFVNTFITGAACLLGTALASLLSNRLGYKALIVITMFVSGGASIGIYFLRNTLQNLLISCIFLAFVAAGNAVVCSAAIDMFPTKVRALALCTAIFTGRLAAVLSNLTLGYLLDISCEVPLFLMGSSLFIGGILGFFVTKAREDTT